MTSEGGREWRSELRHERASRKVLGGQEAQCPFGEAERALGSPQLDIYRAHPLTPGPTCQGDRKRPQLSRGAKTEIPTKDWEWAEGKVSPCDREAQSASVLRSTLAPK